MLLRKWMRAVRQARLLIMLKHLLEKNGGWAKRCEAEPDLKPSNFIAASKTFNMLRAYGLNEHCQLLHLDIHAGKLH